MIVYQTENFGKKYEYRSNRHQNWTTPPHLHEFSEIAFTLDGVTTVLVNGQRYSVPKNHLIFILPNRIHEYSNETTSIMRCAVFSNDHIPAFFDHIKEMQPKDPVIDLSGRTELLHELDTVDHGNTLRLCGLLYLLCDLMLDSTPLVPASSSQNILFREAIEYVSKNFCENIRLCDLAKRLGYHEKYLSSALHSLTGMNFRTFLSSYRINYAKHLLCNKENKRRITEVALQCGFSSINSFNRVFREFTGVTPTDYRTIH